MLLSLRRMRPRAPVHSILFCRVAPRRLTAFLPSLLSIFSTLALPACQDATHSVSLDPQSCTGAGSICTWAGNGDPAFIDGVSKREAALYWPMDIEFAPLPDGRGYILDWQNHRVRRVDSEGLVTTVIGSDSPGDGPGPGAGNEVVAPGVPGTEVSLNHPTDIQFAPDGTLYLAAWHNHKIRKYDVGTGLMQVACGRGPGFVGDPGPCGPDSTGTAPPLPAALLSMPKAIALAPTGDLYIVDTRNFRVRRMSTGTGAIDTVAGMPTRGSGGDDGDPLAAQFSFQKGLDQQMGGVSVDDNPEPGGAVALDASGRLYIADTENQRIRRVDFSLRRIETVAGDGTAGFGGDGGAATSAQINYPRDIEISPDGRLFIADTDNHRIRVVDLATGIIDTVAGNGVAGEGGDGGEARAAGLRRPFGIGFDAAGDLYIADTRNNRIRRVVQP
jgi:sugar lactone lactonase YvrE